MYYAHVPSREIDPAPGEQPASDWAWYDRDALRQSDIASDTVEIGLEAIDVVENWADRTA